MYYSTFKNLPMLSFMESASSSVEEAIKSACDNLWFEDLKYWRNQVTEGVTFIGVETSGPDGSLRRRVMLEDWDSWRSQS